MEYAVFKVVVGGYKEDGTWEKVETRHGVMFLKKVSGDRDIYDVYLDREYRIKIQIRWWEEIAEELLYLGSYHPRDKDIEATMRHLYYLARKLDTNFEGAYDFLNWVSANLPRLEELAKDKFYSRVGVERSIEKENEYVYKEAMPFRDAFIVERKVGFGTHAGIYSVFQKLLWDTKEFIEWHGFPVPPEIELYVLRKVAKNEYMPIDKGVISIPLGRSRSGKNYEFLVNFKERIAEIQLSDTEDAGLRVPLNFEWLEDWIEIL